MAETDKAQAKRRYNQRLKEARIGDADAQYDLALMCANGVGVAQSLEQAITWATAAAERGHAAAQYLLGSSRASGKGVERDLRSATKWLTKAADQGHERAAFKLAKVLSGDAKALANEWQQLAAEKGLPEAQCALAKHLLLEAGETGGVSQALAWCQRAADKGHGPAQLLLGQILESGSTGVAGAEAARPHYRAAARHGIPAAQIALSRMDLGGSGRAGASAANKVPRERRLPAKRWIQYVEHGSAADCFDLGQMLEHGWGIQQSDEQALSWYARAAQQGHAEAQLAMGRLGQSTAGAFAPTKATDWFALAAQQGQADAQYALGHRFASSAMRDADWLEAFGWFSKAASGGHAQANQELAELLQKSGHTIARALQKRAADQGNAQAQYALGRMHAMGEGVPVNWQVASQYYLAAAENGNVDAEFELALAMKSGQGLQQDLERAVLLLQRAARQGHAAAQWRLGEIYASGGPGIEIDVPRATAFCRKAANAGFAPAQATLGVLFAKSKNYTKAVQWWEKAHAGGDVESTYNLACACHSGQGHVRHLQRAFTLWMQAAEAGLAVAANRVGLCYATADGVAMDALEAAKWFSVAVNLGDASATPNLARSRGMLSSLQNAECDRRVDSWMQSYANKGAKAALF